MFAIDTITIIIAAAVIAFAIIGSLVNPFVRGVIFPDEEEEDDNTNSSENTENGEQTNSPVPVTILLTTHDNAPELERNLPAILTQDYPDYQVIIVGEKCEMDTENLLKKFSAEYPRLYYTLIPEGSRYMSKKKLQITLGVKASKNEWILLTDPTCKPDSDQWLKTMAQNCNEDTDFVMGYTHYENEASDYLHFDHLRNAFYSIRRAQHGRPFGTNMQNICFRKSKFMEGNGFLGNLKLIHGEFDFLVNKYANEDNTVVELSPKSWLTEDCPSKKTWHDRHIYHYNTQKYMEGHLSMNILRMIDHTIPHLCLLSSIAAGIAGLLLHNWTIACAGGLGILLLYFIRMGFGMNAANKFDEDISAIGIPFFEWSIIWHHLTNKIRYWSADKSNFTSHKL
jgi:hypothetical protein